MFTSGLSVNEFALLRRLGPQPLAQVMGASVIRTGWQYLPALQPGEIVVGGSGTRLRTPARRLRNRFTEASLSQVRNYQWHAPVVCELDVLTDAWNTGAPPGAGPAGRGGAPGRCRCRRRRPPAPQRPRPRPGHDRVRRDRHGGPRSRLDGSAMAASSPTCPSRTTGGCAGAATSRSACWPPPRCVRLAPPATRVCAARGRRWRNQELEELSAGVPCTRARPSGARLRGPGLRRPRATGRSGSSCRTRVHRDKLSLASSIRPPPTAAGTAGGSASRTTSRGRGDAERRGWVITMHAAGTAIRHAPGPSQFARQDRVRMGAHDDANTTRSRWRASPSPGASGWSRTGRACTPRT